MHSCQQDSITASKQSSMSIHCGTLDQLRRPLSYTKCNLPLLTPMPNRSTREQSQHAVQEQHSVAASSAFTFKREASQSLLESSQVFGNNGGIDTLPETSIPVQVDWDTPNLRFRKSLPTAKQARSKVLVSESDDEDRVKVSTKRSAIHSANEERFQLSCVEPWHGVMVPIVHPAAAIYSGNETTSSVGLEFEIPDSEDEKPAVGAGATADSLRDDKHQPLGFTPTLPDTMLRLSPSRTLNDESTEISAGHGSSSYTGLNTDDASKHGLDSATDTYTSYRQSEAYPFVVRSYPLRERTFQQRKPYTADKQQHARLIGGRGSSIRRSESRGFIQEDFGLPIGNHDDGEDSDYEEQDLRAVDDPAIRAADRPDPKRAKRSKDVLDLDFSLQDWDDDDLPTIEDLRHQFQSGRPTGSGEPTLQDHQKHLPRFKLPRPLSARATHKLERLAMQPLELLEPLDVAPEMAYHTNNRFMGSSPSSSAEEGGWPPSRRSLQGIRPETGPVIDTDDHMNYDITSDDDGQLATAKKTKKPRQHVLPAAFFKRNLLPDDAAALRSLRSKQERSRRHRSGTPDTIAGPEPDQAPLAHHAKRRIATSKQGDSALNEFIAHLAQDKSASEDESAHGVLSETSQEDDLHDVSPGNNKRSWLNSKDTDDLERSPGGHVYRRRSSVDVASSDSEFGESLGGRDPDRPQFVNKPFFQPSSKWGDQHRLQDRATSPSATKGQQIHNNPYLHESNASIEEYTIPDQSWDDDGDPGLDQIPPPARLPAPPPVSASWHRNHFVAGSRAIPTSADTKDFAYSDKAISNGLYFSRDTYIGRGMLSQLLRAMPIQTKLDTGAMPHAFFFGQPFMPKWDDISSVERDLSSVLSTFRLHFQSLQEFSRGCDSGQLCNGLSGVSGLNVSLLALENMTTLLIERFTVSDPLECASFWRMFGSIVIGPLVTLVAESQLERLHSPISILVVWTRWALASWYILADCAWQDAQEAVHISVQSLMRQLLVASDTGFLMQLSKSLDHQQMSAGAIHGQDVMEIWVCLIQALNRYSELRGASRDFWTFFNREVHQIWLTDGSLTGTSGILDGSVAQKDQANHAMQLLLDICKLHQFERDGSSNPAIQTKENWALILSLLQKNWLDRATSEDFEVERHLRKFLLFCHSRLHIWGWTPSADVAVYIYRFFASRGFRDMPTEHGYRLPEFLRRMATMETQAPSETDAALRDDPRTSTEFDPNMALVETVDRHDRCFEIFLKILARVIQWQSLEDDLAMDANASYMPRSKRQAPVAALIESTLGYIARLLNDEGTNIRDDPRYPPLAYLDQHVSYPAELRLQALGVVESFLRLRKSHEGQLRDLMARQMQDYAKPPSATAANTETELDHTVMPTEDGFSSLDYDQLVFDDNDFMDFSQSSDANEQGNQSSAPVVSTDAPSPNGPLTLTQDSDLAEIVLLWIYPTIARFVRARHQALQEEQQQQTRSTIPANLGQNQIGLTGFFTASSGTGLRDPVSLDSSRPARSANLTSMSLQGTWRLLGVYAECSVILLDQRCVKMEDVSGLFKREPWISPWMQLWRLQDELVWAARMAECCPRMVLLHEDVFLNVWFSTISLPVHELTVQHRLMKVLLTISDCSAATAACHTQESMPVLCNALFKDLPLGHLDYCGHGFGDTGRSVEGTDVDRSLMDATQDAKLFQEFKESRLQLVAKVLSNIGEHYLAVRPAAGSSDQKTLNRAHSVKSRCQSYLSLLLNQLKRDYETLTSSLRNVALEPEDKKQWNTVMGSFRVLAFISIFRPLLTAFLGTEDQYGQGYCSTFASNDEGQVTALLDGRIGSSYSVAGIAGSSAIERHRSSKRKCVYITLSNPWGFYSTI
ncbi:hypothetical protein EDD21DRAFT_352382 [Dissophora ornata]|nr:hypothetical protein EDD21DRAFT_352382 [Dissophora ornata]